MSSANRIKTVFVAAGILTLLVACQAISGWFSGGPSGPVFPHAVHNEEGIDCTTCHAGAEEQANAGLPASTKGCMLCHKEIDAEKPVDRTVAAFLVDGKPSWLARQGGYGGEVMFSHAKHSAAEVDCESCHGPQTTGKGTTLRITGGKRRCIECHEKTPRGKDCAVCHKVMRKDSPPPSHQGTWTRLHGLHSRDKIAGLGETACAQCHEESRCTQCHRDTKPVSHTNFWRRRGHGLTAAMDRTSCRTCHEPDSCVRCHNETKPASHRGAFGPPGNTHCATCHLPAKGLGCATCHTNFPAHVDGPPTPATAVHMTAKSPTDCLSCHLALKHPNPGGNCRTCHK